MQLGRPTVYIYNIIYTYICIHKCIHTHIHMYVAPKAMWASVHLKNISGTNKCLSDNNKCSNVQAM